MVIEIPLAFPWEVREMSKAMRARGHEPNVITCLDVEGLFFGDGLAGYSITHEVIEDWNFKGAPVLDSKRVRGRPRALLERKASWMGARFLQLRIDHFIEAFERGVGGG